MDRFVVLLSLALAIVLTLHLGGAFGITSPPPLPPTPAPSPTPAPAPTQPLTPVPSPILPLPPAEFEVISLIVTPPEVTAGEACTVEVAVKNTGGSEGIYTTILTVDGMSVEEKDVTVAPDAIKTVSFQLVEETPGTYKIAIDDVSSGLTVKEKLIAEEVELKYDDGTSDGSCTVGGLSGYVVHFSPPIIPFTIQEVRILANLRGTGYEERKPQLEIWDKDFHVLYTCQEPYTSFLAKSSWVTIEIPELTVNNDFYIVFNTNSRPEGGVYIYYDSSLKNEHSTMRDGWWEERLSEEKTNWMIRVVGNTITSPDPTPESSLEKVELKYDDGTPNGFQAIGFSPGNGYLVDFSPPSTPFTITKIKIFGKLYGTGYEDLNFTVEIWDKNQKTVHRVSHPHTKFTLNPEWVEVEVPEVAVDDSFHIYVFTTSPKEGGINIGYDSSIENEHSEATKGGKIEWWVRVPKERANWMIRVVGNPAAIPSSTEEKPAAEEVELKYDAGEIETLTSQGPGWGYSVHFSPPATPFTISKVKVLARLYGTGYADRVALLEIWDEGFDVLYSREMSATEFSEAPRWVTIETNIAVDGDFRVVFFTNSGGQEGGISIGYDLSGNKASEVAKADGTYVGWIPQWESGPSPKPEDKTNWMIRVVGTPSDQLREN